MNTNLSHKAIFDLIKASAEQEPWINQIRSSEYWKESTVTNEPPVLLIDIFQGDIVGNMISFTLSLSLFDQRNESFSNYTDALSNCRNALENIFTRLGNPPYTTDYGIRLRDVGQFEAVEWVGADALIGYKLTFKMQSPRRLCINGLPTFSGNT